MGLCVRPCLSHCMFFILSSSVPCLRFSPFTPSFPRLCSDHLGMILKNVFSLFFFHPCRVPTPAFLNSCLWCVDIRVLITTPRPLGNHRKDPNSLTEVQQAHPCLLRRRRKKKTQNNYPNSIDFGTVYSQLRIKLIMNAFSRSTNSSPRNFFW